MDASYHGLPNGWRRLIPLLALAGLLQLQLCADDWPQWLGPQRDGVWREDNIVEKFPPGGPPILWRAPIGAGYSGPAVADGKVYVTDRVLDQGANNPSDPFARGVIPGSERVLCLNAETGEIVWTHTYEAPYTVSYAAGPRATPTVDSGRVYALGAEGSLRSLDAANGELLWSKDFGKDYGVKTPMWGFAAHPLIDGDKLICLVGGKDALVVAFDRRSGKEIWRALSAAEPGYAPPTMIEYGGEKQLIIWSPEAVHSLNPSTGESYWNEPWEARMALSIAMPRKEDDLLYLSSFYSGSFMLRLKENSPGAEPVWQSKKVSEKDTDALHCMMSTPFFEGDYIYGVCSYGQLRCIKADTGERVWETMKATTGDQPERWANAFLVKHQERFFLFNERGELIIAELTPDGYEEISRAKILEPTNNDVRTRKVVWTHPAFAQRSAFIRNDKELVRVDLSVR